MTTPKSLREQYPDPVQTVIDDAARWIEASTGRTLTDPEYSALYYGVRVGYNAGAQQQR